MDLSRSYRLNMGLFAASLISVFLVEPGSLDGQPSLCPLCEFVPHAFIYDGLNGPLR